MVSRKMNEGKVLEGFLVNQRWREADKETLKLMFRLGGCEGNHLALNCLEIITCKDLKTIDRLWYDCSRKRFGFRVQLDIFRQCNVPVRRDEPSSLFHGKYMDKDFSDFTVKLG